MAETAETEAKSNSQSFLSALILQIVQSPVNIALVCVIAVLLYKIIKSHRSVPTAVAPPPELPKMKKRDFTVEELREFDGTKGDGRVLVAVNGNVYDVSKGKRMYGPGGPYAAFAGRDASRGLATFSVSTKTDGYDDLSDLNTMEMDSIREWEEQFREKYDLVGRLLKPGELANNYSDEEDEPSAAGDKSKDE